MVFFRQIDPDFIANLSIHFISSLDIISGIKPGIYCIAHHLLLHFHLLRVLSELLQDLGYRGYVHVIIHLLHHGIDTFEGIDHALVDLGSRQSHGYRLQLARHRIVLGHLVSHPNHVLGHGFRGAVLILLRQLLNILEHLLLVVLQLYSLALDLADGAVHDALVLPC